MLMLPARGLAAGTLRVLVGEPALPRLLQGCPYAASASGRGSRTSIRGLVAVLQFAASEGHAATDDVLRVPVELSSAAAWFGAGDRAGVEADAWDAWRLIAGDVSSVRAAAIRDRLGLSGDSERYAHETHGILATKPKTAACNAP